MPQRTDGGKGLLRIVLVGFMCSGKSTVGREIARRLGWEFVDTDEEIERREGMTVPQIFALRGEAYFRGREREVLEELLSREGVVISTGGGLGADPSAMELMKRSAFVVWLKISFEEFLRRCASDQKRPLLRRGEEELRRLLSEREKVYRTAHLTVSQSAPERMAGDIIRAWESFSRSSC